MRFEIRAVNHDGLCVVWKRIKFVTSSSNKMTLYTCGGDVIYLHFKNYKYIKIVPNEEGKDGK